MFNNQFTNQEILNNVLIIKNWFLDINWDLNLVICYLPASYFVYWYLY